MSVATPMLEMAELPGATLTAAQDSLLAQAYDEYCRAQEAGTAPDAMEFCDRFPSIKAALATLLSVDRLVDEDVHFLDPAEVHWPEPGEQFVGFRLERELGRGRFSHVFLATEPEVGHRRVVVKVAQGGMDEALTLGRLAHPNIVPIFSVRKHESTKLGVVCMPYLGEATLGDLLARVLAAGAPPRDATTILEAAAKGHAAEPPTATDAASVAYLSRASYLDGIRRLTAQLLDALAFIHAEGVCHRDLKPSNVLLTRAGVPMLLDFNLSGDERHARIGLGGTPTYMAPEQLQRLLTRDGTGLDGRADLFSLGVMLYELLTGRQPFTPPPRDLNKLPQIRQHLLAQYSRGAAPVRARNPAVDDALARLVDRCLAPAPADRPASAQAARAILEAPPRMRTPFMRRRGLMLALALPMLLQGSAVCHVATPVTRIAGSPSRPPDDLALGVQACRLGNYSDARVQLDRYLHAHPQDARGWFQRGVALLQLKEYDLAVMDFTTADRLKADGLTKACLGYACQQNKQAKPACYHFDQAIKAGYETAEVLNNLGCLHVQTGALAEAQSELTRAIQRAPHMQAAYHNRGLAYLRQAILLTGAKAGRQPDAKLLRSALGDFQRALDIGPPSAELHRDLAAVYAYLSAEDAPLAAKAIEQLAHGVQHGLDRNALRQRPFPKHLGRHATYAALFDQVPPSHPYTRAQLFIAMPPP
jgi:serine/threonine protein kinase/Flp pilus assembly protein TadD